MSAVKTNGANTQEGSQRFAVLEASDETIAQDFEGEDDDDTIACGTLP
jgi:hypothetical protein